MTTPSNKRGCPTCNGVEPKSCLRCRGEARLSDWSDELPPPVREDAMTTPTPNPLVDVLAEWEDKFGAMAAIMPHEWAELFHAVTQACIRQSPRQLRRELAAAQAELERVGDLCNKHYLDAVDAKERAERSEAEAKKNAKDAERYRWLRGNKPDYRGLVAVINLRDNTDAWLSGEYLDKAIDAAIAAREGR